MTSPGRFRRIDELFRAASGVRAAGRNAFLHEQCGNDEELINDVLALLDEDARDRGVLDSPAFSATAILSSIDSGAATDGALPELIGRYRIVRELGRGGMGVVYEAIQQNPHRTVALKVINAGYASHAMLRRFEREAELLGRLQHPGIAGIFEAGTFESGGGAGGVGGGGGVQPFFAMELVRGRPLIESADQSSLDHRQRLELIARICDAVEHAHRRGVIHRDLKPSNILVDESGQPRILDFGIARATDVDMKTLTMRTDVGQLIGTIAYMSPEQAAGDPAQIDARSDLYSIGVIAFELLTRRLPHDIGKKLLHEAVRIIREDEPTSLSSIDRSLRGDVETIIGKALEKDRTRRYQSAGDLARDIRRHLADQPITARPPSAIYQLRKFTRRNKAIVGGVAAGFLLMLVGLVISLREAHNARMAQATAELKSAEATRQTIRATLTAAAMEIDGGDAAAAARSLNGIDPAYRRWEWQVLNARLDDSVARIEDDSPIVGAQILPDGREVLTLSASGTLKRWDARRAVALDTRSLTDGPVQRAVFSADGTRIVAAVRSDGTVIRAWNGPDSTPAGLGTFSGSPRLLEMSPTGRWAFLAIGSKIVVLFDLDAGSQKPLKSDGTVQGATFLAADTQVALATTGAVQFVDCESGAVRQVIWTENGGMASDSSIDGALLVTGGQDRAVHLYDRVSRKETARLEGHAGSVRAVRLLPESSLVLSIALDRSIAVWDLPSRELVRRFLAPTASVYQPSIDASGSTLVTRSRPGVVNVWDLRPSPVDGNELHHDRYVYAVAFTPDGRRIVTGGWDKAIRIWDAATRQPVGVNEGDHGYVTALAVSPDGRYIVSGHHVKPAEAAPLRVWDAATGALVHDFPRQDGEAKAIAFEPGGHRFVVIRTHAPLTVYDLSTRQSWTLEPRPEAMGGCAAWSPDGRTIAVSYSGGVMHTLAADSGDLLKEFKIDRSVVHDCSFSADGRLLVTAMSDHSVQVWDVNSGERVRTLQGHADDVYAVSFTPDGSRVASGSRDTSIRIWDPASGDEMLQLRGHTQYVYRLAFSPDGSMLVSASGDGTARVWDTRPLHVQQQALARRQAMIAQVQPLVDDLFRELGNGDEVAVALRSTSDLGDEERETALQMVLTRCLRPSASPSPPGRGSG